ncbi:hypothetical protein NEUTE1DRAFT_98335 [Neurospora tetrasperma FGSC 2508]|uniref:Uncharacterized protein n=1 Tax=Neurospora tetrasperma (strain FGSC 2508 / ATCC MYA-4615 / P0657) TaxID=510951 RepID=F8MBZ1_NEUT8|nr:uncharacterized protein NEUTE1DRAFT_98335 [Neurospora tetrasperma FGSC 2508]EGO61200.1 hypothetical protein NEUTE1DRAFT_98335 [Neurospora tetrasperma FGSC 2508]EGZ74795.1 hypothetical protein NEUTE2DRAFT_125745 [Neurospora tetrasperma FGSC 2509]
MSGSVRGRDEKGQIKGGRASYTGDMRYHMQAAIPPRCPTHLTHALLNGDAKIGNKSLTTLA